MAAVANVATVDEERSSYVAAVPPLTWMSAAAALADLVIARILLLLGHGAWSNEALAALDKWGGFASNLAVVSALVALSFCLVSLGSSRGRLPISARAGIAGFGWILVPIIALMTFLPRAWTRPELVVVVAGLAHALILLLVLAGLHWKSTKAIVATLILTLIAALSGVTSMIVTMVGRRAYWEHTDRLANAFRWSGELAYLLIPLGVGLTVSIAWREARGKAALALSGLAAGVVAAGMAVWSEAVGSDLPDLVYGAFRLELLPEQHFILYAIPLGIGAAVTVAAVLSRDPIRRQLGAALLLLLSAGYAPRSPGTLLLTVLAVALLTRAAIANAQAPRGEKRGLSPI